MEEQKISRWTRIGSMLLDHIIMSLITCVICLPLFIPLLISGFTNDFHATHEQNKTDYFEIMKYFALLGFAATLCKDSINGRSLAKRILNLQIVDYKTGQVASPFKCLLRNIFFIIWPIEGIIAFINPEGRIGDIVAGTSVIPYEPSLETKKINYFQISLAFGISYSVLLLTMAYFNNSTTNYDEPKIKFVEDSYNESESKATEKLFNDSLGEHLKADIRIYDKIQNENLKYISIILNLKEDYYDDNKRYEKLKSETVSLLLTKFPLETFSGKIQYTYKTKDGLNIRTEQVGLRKTNELMISSP